MHGLLALLLFSLLPLMACSTRGPAPRDPGGPAPTGSLHPDDTGVPAQPEAGRPLDSSGTRHVPVRPDQAPLVDVRDVLAWDSLLGRRVRVAGRCAAAAQGHRAGFWTLTAADTGIEVRGQVPSSCVAGDGEDLVIFAQVEAQSARSRERLRLRLPD